MSRRYSRQEDLNVRPHPECSRSDRHRAVEPGRAFVRHLFAPAARADRVRDRADRGPHGDADHGAASVPGIGKPEEGHLHVHQLAGRFRHGGHGDPRHDAIYPAARGPGLPRLCGLDGGVRSVPICSRLVGERIWFGTGPIQDHMATLFTSKLRYLESENPKKDIYMYTNSPGGSVTAGMAIHDTMQYIRPRVGTVCIGFAASMGAFLLTAGEPGMRVALNNARIMIHQPSGGAQGMATDIEIQAKEILRIRDRKSTRLNSSH